MKSFTRYRNIIVACAVRSAIRTIARAEEFQQRVGLAERDELLLAKLANERLAAQRRSAGESAECCLRSLPELQNVRRAVLSVPRTIKPRRNRVNRSQRGKRGLLVRVHLISRFAEALRRRFHE